MVPVGQQQQQQPSLEGSEEGDAYYGEEEGEEYGDYREEVAGTIADEPEREPA